MYTLKDRLIIYWIIIKTILFLFRYQAIAFLGNTPEYGLRFFSMFKMDTQPNANLFADKLEWFAREIRAGRITK